MIFEPNIVKRLQFYNLKTNTTLYSNNVKHYNFKFRFNKLLLHSGQRVAYLTIVYFNTNSQEERRVRDI